MKALFVFVISMVAAGFPPVGVAEQVPEAGYVERVACPQAFIWTTSQGKTKPVIALTIVHQGDRFSLSSAAKSECEPSVAINVGGSSFVLNKGNMPFEIKAPGGSQRTVLQNMIGWISGLVTQEVRKRVETKSRGEEFALRVIDQTGAKMLSGRRTVRLSWRGGRGAYTVEVRNLTETVFAADNLSENVVEVPERHWQHGEYLIRISDSTGASLDTVLEVVGETDLPVMPSTRAQAIDHSSLDEPAKATLRAAWLAYQPGGWAWEAYQRAIELESGYPPAGYLRKRLEQTTPNERARQSFW